MYNTKLDQSNQGNLAHFPFHISGREDIVFIHIPKTAGTSFRRTLNFNKVDKESGIRKHTDATKIISLIGNDNWKESFKFTFVRNPWDRMLSHYYYVLRKGEVPNLEEQVSFKKWALNKIFIKQKNKKLQFNLRPQINWLKNHEGIVDMDFIGRFEQLDSDFSLLTKRLSISTHLVHANQNPLKVNYRDHYDVELKEKVTRFYQEDVDYFKYKF